MRVLAGVRVSRISDESTSPDRQIAAIRRWANANGHDVTDQAIDLDVSAFKVAPWERPEIGDRMSRPEEFDIIAWSALDRAVRRMTAARQATGRPASSRAFPR